MNSQQLFVATRDGSLSVWDMTDWIKMKCKTVASSICSLLVSKSTEHFFVVTKETGLLRVESLVFVHNVLYIIMYYISSNIA